MARLVAALPHTSLGNPSTKDGEPWRQGAGGDRGWALGKGLLGEGTLGRVGPSGSTQR